MNQIKNNCPHTIEYWKGLNRAWQNPARFKYLPSNQLTLNLIQRPLVAIAMIISSVITPILFITDFFYTKYQKKHRVIKLEGDCTNLFTKNILDKFQKKLLKIYLENLTNHPAVTNSIQTKTASELLMAFNKHLNISPPEGIEARRHWYSTFMTNLRNLINEVSNLDEENEVKQFLYDFIQSKFLDLDFIKDLSVLIPNYSKNQINKLNELYSSMLRDPNLQKDGDTPKLFDAQYFGNVPFSLGRVQLTPEQDVRIIRMPCVTKDMTRIGLSHSIDKVEIIEEFDFFLSALAAKNKKHLYVNLMVRHVGNQSKRTKTIENLKNKYPETCIVMTLDKDSDFYHQKNEYSAEISSSSDFKETFLRRILDKNGDFFIPESLTDLHIEEILNFVHKTIYKGKEVLTKDERLNFIEHIYCQLIEKVSTIHQISSLNMSCLNCIDRGQSQAFNFLSYSEQVGKHETNESLLNIILLTPAVLVANRAPQERFFARANSFRESLVAGKVFSGRESLVV